jgi:hypothetical protein
MRSFSLPDKMELRYKVMWGATTLWAVIVVKNLIPLPSDWMARIPLFAYYALPSFLIFSVGGFFLGFMIEIAKRSWEKEDQWGK